ncbi:hypothetical protein [Brevundimonas sp. SL130]|uniref:hypothetical protein n=1 Tax=Brevundimonas sp. SL130 TaxID=2995143 RepID=UPI00226CB0EA|nr:hypothetical protein [Brevundimonas sp. SL130]WAC61237.1 hypothetical protein OU998_07305 [Brevundimonas sp. SL130]
MKRAEQAAAIAARLNHALHLAEAGQDQSINRLGKLAQALTRSRKDAGLSATVGQPAFNALARAMAAQIEAQEAMVELHHALAEVKENTKFRSVRLGGLDKQDEPVPRETRLMVVDNAA